MPTDVLMPQMGESISEGTVTRWLKKVGDTVSKDEPLFEISTDKVDAEIPSPVAGTLAKILVQEGQTAGVHTVVAQIESASAEGPAPTPPAPAAKVAVTQAPQAIAAEAAEKTEKVERTEAGLREEVAPVRSSPLVRRLAEEHNVDLSQVQGTGAGGRVTKEDLLAYIEQSKAGVPAEGPGLAEEVPTRVEIVPMSPMRKKIAERMVFSRHTAAHVTTVFAVDFSPVLALYQREKDRFERDTNTRLTFTPFFARAVIDALKRFPILNSSVEGDNIIYKKSVHMGIAVALDWGLIVPVVHYADEKSFLGLTRAINDVADRARRKKLSVSEVQGGTFTITNPGVYGSLFSTPIINPPQVGIVGVHAINKMPVVIDDAIAIRSIVHLSLSYDHRLVDGAVADQFMAAVKNYLENWEESLL